MSTPQVANISAQQMIDARLNAFAVDLLLESYAPATRDGAAAEPPAPIAFAYRGVLVALAPLDAREITIAPAAARLRALLTTESAEPETPPHRAGLAHVSPFRWHPGDRVWEFFVDSWGGWIVLRRGTRSDAEPMTFAEGTTYLEERPDHPILTYEETKDQPRRGVDEAGRTYVIAETHHHAEMIAQHLGIPRNGWTHVRDRSGILGVRPGSRVAVADYRDGTTARCREALEAALGQGLSVEHVDLAHV